MMKRIVGTLACLLFCCSAFCQQDIPALIAKLNSNNISFDFKVKAVGKAGLSGSGNFSIQGKSYCVNMGGQRIISDGATLWTIQDPQEEVYVEDAAALPSFVYDSGKLMKMLSNLSYPNGGIKGTFTSPDGKEKYDFEISHISVKPLAPASAFSVNTAKLGDSWIVTDLR